MFYRPERTRGYGLSLSRDGQRPDEMILFPINWLLINFKMITLLKSQSMAQDFDYFIIITSYYRIGIQVMKVSLIFLLSARTRTLAMLPKAMKCTHRQAGNHRSATPNNVAWLHPVVWQIFGPCNNLCVRFPHQQHRPICVDRPEPTEDAFPKSIGQHPAWGLPSCHPRSGKTSTDPKKSVLFPTTAKPPKDGTFLEVSRLRNWPWLGPHMHIAQRQARLQATRSLRSLFRVSWPNVFTRIIKSEWGRGRCGWHSFIGLFESVHFIVCRLDPSGHLSAAQKWPSQKPRTNSSLRIHLLTAFSRSNSALTVMSYYWLHRGTLASVCTMSRATPLNWSTTTRPQSWTALSR